ncbi:hypothetical protein ACFE04_010938 [Oxalis oulophora]
MALAFATIFLVLSSFPNSLLQVVYAQPRPSFDRIVLPQNAFGPESIAFGNGGMFYTGVADGRILSYQPGVGFQDFAFSTPNRSRAVCDGTTDLNLGPTCGRPFGLGYHSRTNQLYICDAFYGLLVVGTNGRLATQLASSAEGQPIKFCNGLDVDQNTGVVYFTDVSLNYDLRTLATQPVNDTTGRVLRYNPNTRDVTVLVRNLSNPSGVAVSGDSSFIIFSELIGNRTSRFWLTGPRQFTTETINFQPRPNNIKRTFIGDFWEAAATPTQMSPSTVMVPVGLRINGNGNVVQQVSFEPYYNTTQISEVQASTFGFSLYISSRSVNFIGVYRF